MKTLFTVTTSHIDDRGEAIANLYEMIVELESTFPAYKASFACHADYVSALLVETVNPNAPVPAHLNGWGHAALTLKLVA